MSGLWHGAAWTFVLFGFTHGVLLVIGRYTLPYRNRFWKWVTPQAPQSVAVAGAAFSVPRVRYALGIATTMALWIFSGQSFRSQSLGDAWTMTKRMFTVVDGTYTSIVLPGFDQVDVLLIIAFVGLFIFVDILEERGKTIEERLAAMPTVMRWSIYIGISLIVLLFGSYGAVPFIYFQF